MMNKTLNLGSCLIALTFIFAGLSPREASAFGIRAPFEVKRDPASTNAGASTGGGSTTPAPTPAPVSSSSYKAYWEGKNVKAAEWTVFAQQAVMNYGDSMIKGTSDMASFCPHYDRLGTQDRINFWVELLAAMTKYESGFNPASRMVETTMPNDPVTGAPTSSEGLLQLSYSDEANYKPKVPTGVCDFDYSKDKAFAVTDLRRTILDPKTNITCAVGILNYQISRKNAIAVASRSLLGRH